MNTLIQYLYRDTSNYKIWNDCVIRGSISPEQIDAIIKTLVDGDNFIPHCVGMPEIRFSSINEDDTPWFELSKDDFKPTNQEPTLNITAIELIERFQKARNYKLWDAAAAEFYL